MAHHFIRDGWATSLQQVIATAGYILSVSKLETENPHLLDFNIGVKPLDLTFNIDPSPSLAAPAPCEYFCIDGDVTITPSVEPLFCSEFLNKIDTVTVAAHEQLQRKQKSKLIQESKAATPTEERIDGDKTIGELIQKLIILTPMAVDPYGQLGPFIMRFVF